MTDYILANCKAARASWFEDAGHGPFLEEADRFNEELIRLAKRCQMNRQ
jgi:pimeloyl-ACP methyl ester carboxylesterase